jgi:hypothetical protein
MDGTNGGALLDINYVLNDQLDPGEPAVVKESRGAVQVELSPELFSPQACAVLQAIADEFLAGGHWFQLWRGEIISIASPEDARQGGTVARIHRGPVVHEAS